MYFYEVSVSSPRYHGSGPLTYGSDLSLLRGQIVKVPFGNKEVVGIVWAKVTEPDFNSKLVSELVSLEPLPDHLLQLKMIFVKWLPTCPLYRLR